MSFSIREQIEAAACSQIERKYLGQRVRIDSTTHCPSLDEKGNYGVVNVEFSFTEDGEGNFGYRIYMTVETMKRRDKRHIQINDVDFL